MDWTLELIGVPVTDVDRAKQFYKEQCGFRVDIDAPFFDGARFVQLTPPGSRCSIVLESGMPDAPGQSRTAPGSLQGLQLCVTDIEAARAELVGHGIDVTPVMHVGASGWTEGRGETWTSFLFFQDPDGNGWAVQEAPAPLAER
ncbi:VOC family protein [Streptomyces sp. NPDC056479]|uniref:VOC family protein n=1 Tax=unclassified Streptomyces TaxID=2593676 RepID=UPI003676B6CA